MTVEIVPSSASYFEPKDVLIRKITPKLLQALCDADPKSLVDARGVEIHCLQGRIAYTFDIFYTRNLRRIVKLAEGVARPHSQDAEPLERFAKECWISEHLSPQVGAPRTQSVGRVAIPIDGVEHTFAFIIQEYIPFPPAGPLIQSRKQQSEFASQLGCIARAIHSIPTVGFGNRFDASTTCFSVRSWPLYVDELIALSHFERLFGDGILPISDHPFFMRRMKSLRGRSCLPKLYHNDLLYNWNNVLVDPTDVSIRSVIDWEYSGSGDPLVVELGSSLVRLFEDGVLDIGNQEFLHAFLSGYGISLEEYEANYRMDAEAFAMLYAPARLLRPATSSAILERQRRVRCFLESTLKTHELA